MKSDEKNYIKRLKAGHEDALDYIIDNYLPLVKGAVYKVLGVFKDEGLLEECINDVFLSVWNNAGKFQGDNTNFKQWIFAVSKFRAIDFYRKKIKNAEMILDAIEISSEKSIEDEIVTKENEKEILKLINELEPMDREIFILKFFLGYKAEEIAIKLNVTKASIDNRIYRGKKKLKEKVLNLKLEVV
jgi:RNA polymerase sigma-70 factor (ECF subfamily)